MFSEIDKGINDMENDRELPLDEAFEVVSKLREMYTGGQYSVFVL